MRSLSPRFAIDTAVQQQHKAKMTPIDCRQCRLTFAAHDGDDGRCPRCAAPYVLDAWESHVTTNNEDAIVPFSITAIPAFGEPHIAD